MNEDRLHKFTMRKEATKIIDKYIKLGETFAIRVKELEKENNGLLKENLQMYEDIYSLNNQVDKLEAKLANLKQKFNK